MLRCWCVLVLASAGAAAAQDFAGREKLRAHGEQEFRKDVIKVTAGVYAAVGYSMADAILIVGDGGSLVVDTTGTAELTDFVLAVDAANVDANRLKARARSELGERQTSANARNYYLSVAQHLLRDLPAR